MYSFIIFKYVNLILWKEENILGRIGLYFWGFVDHELLIDPPPPRGNFVHYDFLKLRFKRNKMTHVGHLEVGALQCDSHVNCVTLKHFQIPIVQI